MAEHERAWQEAEERRRNEPPPVEAELDTTTVPAGPDWPALGEADQRIVDQWWDHVDPVYRRETSQPQEEDWLLRRTIEFLAQQPRLFRYLYLHEEFLFELGGSLARAGRMSDYVALLLRLRAEQPDTFEQSFGWYERDILTELIRTGRRAEIPQCFASFHRHPSARLDQRFEVTALLAWQGLELELVQFLEPLALKPASSAEAPITNRELRWLNDLAMLPFLKAGDVSPEARSQLRQTLLAIGHWTAEDLVKTDWMSREFELALLPPSQTKLDLKCLKGLNFFNDAAWSFSGWVRRHKALPWSTTRFLGEKLTHYWSWMALKTKKKSLHLEAKELDPYLADGCRELLWLDGVAIFATLQALAYFTEYLAAHDYFNYAETGRLQAGYARLFQQALPGIEASDPAMRLYSSYEALIGGTSVAASVPSIPESIAPPGLPA